jgi:dihydrofolate synthase/folylpolyglutamate synthase
VTPYHALLARLVPARRFGVVLGLERMRGLLDRLGAPDRRLGRIVHVAGTNGKGSTVTLVAALARAAGLRVATYTSPHLTSLRERITIDGTPITEEAIVAAGAVVQSAGGDELTFFEQVTAIACVAIADAHVDVTVLEVGLGGRLDATNTIGAPEVAVITGVALDHEAVLGPGLEAIAGEKAGIVKAGQRVVIGGAGEPRAVPWLVEHAQRAGAATIDLVDETAIAAVPPVALVGAHQRANAAAAIAALHALGLPIVASALTSVVHPGRFERIGDVVLDGAHNPHGATALAATLTEQGARPVCVLAVSADKDVAGIVRALASAVSGFIATRYQQDRALEPQALAAIIQAETPLPVTWSPDLETAFATAIGSLGPPAERRARPPGPPTVLVAGSLFLVGEARALLLGVPVDPILATDPAATKSP